MRKQIAIFIVILAIPGVFGIQNTYLDNYTVDRSIRTFETSSNPNFEVLINTKRSINLFSREGVEYSEDVAEAAFSMDTITKNRTRLWLTGVKFASSNPRTYILAENGTILSEIPRFLSHDFGAFVNQESYYMSTSVSTEVENFGGEDIWSRNWQGIKPLRDKHVSGSEVLLLLDGRSNRPIQLVKNGERLWEVDKPSSVNGNIIDSKALIWSKNYLSVRFLENGSAVWEREIGTERFRPVVVGKSIFYAVESKLVSRSLETGEKMDERELGVGVDSLKKFPEKRWLAARHGEKISIFTLEGENVHSFRAPGIDEGFQFTQYDKDSMKEIAYGDDKTVHIVEVGKKKRKVNQSLKETVFVGSGEEMLKAVALNRTAFVAREFQEVEEEVNATGLQPVGVGEVEGLRAVEDVEEAFNISREKYYAGSREKAVYVAAFAAAANASLTFESSEADRDFSNYSMRELRERFIERFKPHHVAVADLDTSKGTLAAYMAVKQGILPVDFDQEFSYPGEGQEVDAREWNRNNGVIELDRKVEEAFEIIGENRNTVFDGKHISLLSGPRRMHEDPVEKGIIGDPKDGKRFFSDLGYGDLDKDGRLEAGVGRYPKEVGEASALYRRSLVREKGKNALVAAEYLHRRWPVILASMGGGMWHGKNTGYTLENQGYRVKRLVEYRSEPLVFLLELMGMPKPEDSFFIEFKSHQDKIATYLGKASVKMVKNAVFVFKSFERAQRTLQFYLEFDWIGWEPLDQQLDFPDGASLGELRELLFSALPDRYGHLTESSLRTGLSRADVVFYHGIGNSERWVLPDSHGNGYSGSNNLTPVEVPDLERAVVWDSSAQAGKRGARMREAFLEKGAAAYAGTSSNSYSSYTSLMAREFFRHGRTTGESLEEAVNRIRSGMLIYHPTSMARTGVRDKMESSLSLYGNPEMVKDPVSKPDANASRSCENGVCRLEVRFNPEPDVVEVDGEKKAVFNTSDYLLQPFAPITPLYTYRRALPGGAEVVDSNVDYRYRTVERLKPKRKTLLSHAGRFYNRTPHYSAFPEKLHRLNSSQLEYVQAAIQYRENSSKVLEKAEATVIYRSPVTLELEREGNHLFAEIYANRKRDVKLGYSIDGDERVRSLELEKGSRRIELTQLEKGVHRVEAFAYSDTVLSRDREKFKVGEEVEVLVFAPDMHLGSTRKVRAIARNPNSFPVSRQLELSLGDRLIPGMLEDRKRTVRLGPGETAELSWRITAIETGTANVSAGKETVRIEVERGSDTSRLLSPEQLVQEISSPTSVFSSRISQEEMRLSWRTPQGRAVLFQNSTHEIQVLETGSFRARLVKTASRKARKIETERGSCTEVIEDGKKRMTGKCGLVMAEKRMELLEEEIRKLKKHSQAIDDRILKTNRNME